MSETAPEYSAKIRHIYGRKGFFCDAESRDTGEGERVREEHLSSVTLHQGLLHKEIPSFELIE